MQVRTNDSPFGLSAFQGEEHTMNFTRRIATLMLVASFALIGLVGFNSGVLAQDDPTPTPAPPSTGSGMLAAVHQGTCQAPAEASAADLGEFGEPTDADGNPVEVQGTLTGPAVLQASASGLDMDLNETLTGGVTYVILVHQSQQEYSTYLACGEIAGPVVDNNLAVALRPINNAGFAGLATLQSNDGGTTDSTVYLISDLLALSGGSMSGTPETQPTPIAAQGTFPPTEVPTEAPTAPPTEAPTEAPTEVPTEAPTETPAPVEVTTTPDTVEVTPTPA